MQGCLTPKCALLPAVPCCPWASVCSSVKWRESLWSGPPALGYEASLSVPPLCWHPHNAAGSLWSWAETESASHSFLPESLHREDVHKVDIMTFCQQKAAQSLKSETQRSRDSALLWQLLVLLCRQNGVKSDRPERWAGTGWITVEISLG